MESNEARDALVQQMHEIERGRVAPWVAPAPMAWWWPWLFGAWAGTYTLTLALLDGALRSLVQLLHVLVMLGAVAWMRRVRGTYPTGRHPRELTFALAVLFVGALVVCLVVLGAFSVVGAWVAAGVAVALTTVLVALYERLYLRAAQRVRERVG